MVDLDIEMELPEDVERIITTLNNANYSAYVVGGACRDFLMGIEPHDYDITTDAVPAEVSKLFNNGLFNTIPTGEKYGTITVVSTRTGNKYEVTTFRADVYSPNSDGRRPDNVEFGKSILDDLSRRDFTINAIAYSPLTGFADPFNGYEDIGNKIIRCVGKAFDRLREDGLRILRAIRFAARFGFEIEYTLRDSMNSNYSMLEKLSKERINSEIKQILSYKKSEKILMQDVLPLTCKLFNSNTVKILDNYRLTLANLLKDMQIFEAESWLRCYKFSNSDIKTILNYIYIYKTIKPDEVIMKKCFYKYSVELVEDVIKYWLNSGELIAVYNNVYEHPYSMADLAINGDDLTAYRGVLIGKLLKHALEFVWEDRYNNNKDKLLKEVNRYYETNFKTESI